MIVGFLMTHNNSHKCNSQTRELEIQNLDKRYKNGEFTLETYREYAADWRRVLDDLNGYPTLPYDTTTQSIIFQKVIRTDFSKDTIFNRLLEWGAITFGRLDYALRHKNKDFGKIILKRNFDVRHKVDYKNYWGTEKEGISTKEGDFTMVFTISDNAVKVQVFNVGFECITFYTYGSFKVYRSIHSLYPITNFEPEDWKDNLDLLYQTSNRIESMFLSIENYVSNANSDYRF